MQQREISLVEKLKAKWPILFLCLLAISCGPSQDNFNSPTIKVISDIIGGTEVPEGQFPEVVGISANETVFCSGVLISPQWVLTAAHCLNIFPANSMTVFTGNSMSDAVHYQIESVYIHPQFFSGRYGFKTTRAAADLGLIKLRGTIINVIPASLVPGPVSYTTLDSKKVRVVGFGAREGKQGTSLTGEKYQVEVARGFFTAGEMLFGNENPRQGGCHGDSGGPLFQFHPQYNRLFLTGITSRQLNPFGLCTDSIGVATEIGFFLPWIEAVVGVPLVDDKQRSKEAKSLIKSRIKMAREDGIVYLSNIYGLRNSDLLRLNLIKTLPTLTINLMGTGIASLKELALQDATWVIDPLFIDSESRQNLIINSPSPNIQFPKGLLIEALMRQDQELAELALKEKSQITAIDSYGNSTLFWAVANNDVELVESLLGQGVDPKIVNTEMISPLMIAANPLIQSRLLQLASDEELHQLSKKGWSLLHFAIDRGDFDFLKILLDKGVPANLAGTSADLPFEFALIRGHEEMAMLIEQYL